jgi:ribosome-binding ATPase YchF (GTP1/OBG family)
MLIGIVGKPSAGKSTFFKAATLAEAEIAERPFTTIKPNRGVGYIKTRCPCAERDLKCDPQNSFCINGWRFAPIELLDVAGLVPEAHRGRGLGNQFLDDLRQAHVFIHVVDASGRTDSEGNATKGHDPMKDVEFLGTEIDMWLMSLIKKHWHEVAKRSEHGKSDFVESLSKQLSGLGIKSEHIRRSILPKRPVDYSDMDLREFAKRIRENAKPMIIAANKMDLKESEDNIPVLNGIPCCAEAELALREAAEKGLLNYVPGEPRFEILKKGELSENQKAALNFVEKLLEKWGNTGVQQCLNKASETMKWIVVFPVEDESKLTDKDGHVLPDAIIMSEGSTALDLAYKVHEEIGKGFIRAIDCRTKKVISKDHVLRDRDIIKVVSK